MKDTTKRIILFYLNGVTSFIGGLMIALLFGGLEGIISFIGIWILANQYHKILWRNE